MKKYLCFFITLSVIFLISLFFVSYGSWNFLGNEVRSESYDSLGKSLTKFEFDVEPNTINWEGFDVNGKKYMYFGPFPAFLRIILNKIAPQNYGKWARVSSIIAIVFMTLVSFWIFSYAIKKNRAKLCNNNAVFVMMLTLGLILGTPIFYLLSCSRIYHEAILWAVAWEIATLSLIYYIVKENQYSSKLLFILGLCMSCTLLSKITFALPLYAISLYLFYKIFKRKDNVIKKMGMLLLAASLGGIFQLIYNYVRFGSIWETFPRHMHYWQEVKDYGLFNVNRIYDGLVTFLIPKAENFNFKFPYFFEKTYGYKNEYLFPDWKEPSIAITLSCMFFTFILCYFLFKGFYVLVKNGVNLKQLIKVNFEKLMLFFLISQCLLICAYCFFTQRYITEFVPLIFFLMLLFTTNVKRKFSVNMFCVFIAASIFITILSTISEMIYYPHGEFSRSAAWLYMWKHITTMIG